MDTCICEKNHWAIYTVFRISALYFLFIQLKVKKWLSSGSCWNTAMVCMQSSVWGLLNIPDSQSFPLWHIWHLLSLTWYLFHLLSFLQEIVLGQHSYHSRLLALKQSRACICLPWASNKERLFCLLYGLHSFNELEKPLNIPLNRGTIDIKWEQ